MRRYLIVANQTLAAEPLVSRMRELARAAPSSFHVVVPATPPRDHLWTEGEARATAHSRLDAPGPVRRARSRGRRGGR